MLPATVSARGWPRNGGCLCAGIARFRNLIGLPGPVATAEVVAQANVEGNRRHGFMEESVDAKGDGSEQVAQLEGVSLPDGSVRIR